MTSEYQQELADFGWNTTLNSISVILSAFAFGWLLLMTFIALHYLDNIQSWRSPQSILSACCVFMLFLSILQLLVSSGNLLAQVAPIAGFISNSTSNRQDKGWNFLYPWPQAASIIVADSIVLWRAWVMFLNSQIWKCLALIIMAANIAINITYCIVSNIDIDKSATIGENIFEWLLVVTSLIVNVFATISIYWKTRVLVRNATAALQKRTHIQKILFLLIESGATFSVLQLLALICYLILNYISGGPLSLAVFLFTATDIYVFMAVMWYPTAVIILVKTKNSPIEQSIHYSHSVSE